MLNTFALRSCLAFFALQSYFGFSLNLFVLFMFLLCLYKEGKLTYEVFFFIFIFLEHTGVVSFCFEFSFCFFIFFPFIVCSCCRIYFPFKHAFLLDCCCRYVSLLLLDTVVTYLYSRKCIHFHFYRDIFLFDFIFLYFFKFFFCCSFQ